MHDLLVRNTLFLLTSALAASTALAGPADDTMSELAKSRNCMACHQSKGKVIGPGYIEIAKKYAKTQDAEQMLAKKIRQGSTGVWGSVPMPPNLQATEEDARLLARWILAK